MRRSKSNPQDLENQFCAASNTPSFKIVAKKKSPMDFFSPRRSGVMGTSVNDGFEGIGRIPRRKACAASNCFFAPSATMHKSTSLSGRASPRACEPKRYTARNGITRFIASRQLASVSRCGARLGGRFSNSSFMLECYRRRAVAASSRLGREARSVAAFGRATRWPSCMPQVNVVHDKLGATILRRLRDRLAAWHRGFV